MKSSMKQHIYSFTLVGTLLLFFAFSNGLSFSLHYCDSCHQTKLYFYQHPNCCEESAHIHDSEKKCAESCGCSHEADSHENGIATNDIKGLIDQEAHKSHHAHGSCSCSDHKCKTTHKYFRIASPFLLSNQVLTAPTLITLYQEIEILKSFDITIPIHTIRASNPPPLLTKAGERDFLHFISQQILYA